MQQRFLTIWPYFIFAAGLLAALQFWPASYWLEVSTVQINSGHDSLDLDMLVDRKIKRSFNGATAIAIREWQGAWVVVCSGQSGGGGDFLAGARMPKRLTLGMWTAGQCLPLRPGQYTVSKTWTIQSLGLMPDKTVTQTSNAFNVWP